MSNPIVRALEQVAQRVGRTLSRDAGRAVEEMYRQAGRGVQDVVKRVSDADEHSGRKLVEIAERLGRNARADAAADAQVAERAGLRARFAQILDPTGESASVRAYQDAEIRVDSARYPETAQHIQEAQSGIIWRGEASVRGAPAPSVLTIDRAGAKANRAASLRGIAPRGEEGLDRDEYPPAMFAEGGAGASVKYIDSSDNRGAGSVMGGDLDGLPDGARIKIVVK